MIESFNPSYLEIPCGKTRGVKVLPCVNGFII